MRFVISQSSSPTTRMGVVYTQPSPDPEKAYELAVLHTRQSLDQFCEWKGEMREETEKHIRQYVRDLEEVFKIRFYDPVLGRMRCLTAFDLLQPGFGAQLVLQLKLELEDLGIKKTVIARYLRAVRVFCRHIARHHVVDNLNLRDVYGPLVSPLEDGDIKKVAVRKQARLPTRSEMPRIMETLASWAAGERRYQWEAQRSVTQLLSSFGSGLRGISQRQISLDDQVFDRAAGVPTLANPMTHVDTKTGRTLEIVHEPYPLAYVNYWLAEVRPAEMDPMSGLIYPAIGPGSRPDRPMGSSSFTEALKRPIRYLKERGLVDPQFTYHTTRAVFATHYLEESNSIAALLNRVGWQSITAAAHYIKPRSEAVAEGDARFRRTLGRRG